jgi:hypothetical protein
MTPAFDWAILLAAWFALFGIGACILAVLEWRDRRKARRKAQGGAP